MFYTKEQPGFAYMHCYDIESGLFNFIDAEISDIIDDSPKEYDSELRRVFLRNLDYKKANYILQLIFKDKTCLLR